MSPPMLTRFPQRGFVYACCVIQLAFTFAAAGPLVLCREASGATVVELAHRPGHQAPCVEQVTATPDAGGPERCATGHECTDAPIIAGADDTQREEPDRVCEPEGLAPQPPAGADARTRPTFARRSVSRSSDEFAEHTVCVARSLRGVVLLN